MMMMRSGFRFAPRLPKMHPTTGMPLKKSKGQHILHNEGILDEIVEAAQLTSSDAVFEVGPGTGSLTMKLLPIARKVIAVDIEERMISELETRAKARGYRDKLETHVKDVVKTPLPPRFEVCVANLPYDISTAFLFKLLTSLGKDTTIMRPWRSAVLIFQKEFAERLLADPGEKNFSRLAMNTRLFVHVERICNIKGGSFIPMPTVQSTLIRLTPRELPVPVDFVEWDGMIRILFARKKKSVYGAFKVMSVVNMLENNYKVWCSINRHVPTPMPFRDYMLETLEDLALQKPFYLDVKPLYLLLQRFHAKGIHFVNVAAPTSPAPMT
eukprot:GEMP01056834.1.p1 GENE.GEMP01056834.1~~GEMP01056834.1.p1  ORF type:complete len:326 (+),score=72.89 GEMP01056834.1:81-1058(+)